MKILHPSTTPTPLLDIGRGENHDGTLGAGAVYTQKKKQSQDFPLFSDSFLAFISLVSGE